jgi:tetratricopeptide (TPR) repeat protein
VFLANLEAAEKKVRSQHGEDGVIEAIFAAIGVTNRYFVEFGVEDATECNTACLLQQGWTGLMMDGEGISRNPLASVEREYVTAENINELFAKHHVPGDFDFLGIDIDGNDYWVWKALAYRPRVVVIEYNASVPPELRRVIPYDPHFRWNNSDYFGASLGALAELGNRKGYELVYCERAGTNAFFIARSQLPAGYAARPLAEIYRPPNYCYRGYGHRPEYQRTMIDPDAPEEVPATPFEARRATLGRLFDQAALHQRSGDWEQAEQLYRQILRVDPANAEAHHRLGLVTQKIGTREAGVALIRQAIALDPVQAAYHANLGVALHKQGQLAEAIASYREALRLDPQFADALSNLGIALKDQGQLDEAAACIRQALGLDPAHVNALNNLGVVLRAQGRLDEAIACYRQALLLQPDNAAAQANLDHALREQGRL